MEYGCYKNDEEIFHCYSRKLRDIFLIFLQLKRKAAPSISKNNCVLVLIATDSTDMPKPMQSSVKLHLGKSMKYKLDNDIKLLRSFA